MTNTTADIVGEDPRIAHLEKTKADTERELARMADDLVGAAVEIERQRQRADDEANRAAEMEAQAQREQARADAAERMACELRGIVAAVSTWDPLLPGEARVLEAVRAALSRTEAVAGRWFSKDQMDRAMTAAECAAAERDAAIAARDEAVAKLEKAKGESYRLGGLADERGVLLKEAERARDEVGIQYAAAQAEIARMRPVVDAARRLLPAIHERPGPAYPGGIVASLGIDGLGCLDDFRAAFAALDAVPGDALAPRITAALEASGIDTDNVKGVE